MALAIIVKKWSNIFCRKNEVNFFYNEAHWG